MASNYTAERGLRMQGIRLMAINESLSFNFLDTSLDRCRVLCRLGMDRNLRGNLHLRENARIHTNIECLWESALKLI